MQNVASYLQSELATAIGGSWIATRELIQAEDWKTITANAKAITELIQKIKTK